jgi:hypothetical protein
MSPAARPLLVLLLAAAGCSRHQRNEDFIPPGDAARSAVDAALRSWANGDPVRGDAQRVPGTSPEVLLADAVRMKGRKLAGYTILGEVPAEAPRCFAVKLTFADPPAEVRERYVVVGIDPLWVCRYDDYLLVSHWCHPMPRDEKPPSPGGKP